MLLPAYLTGLLLAESNGQDPSQIKEGSAGRGSYRVRGVCLTVKQFLALLIKRLHHATRSYKDFVAQVTFLTIIVILMCRIIYFHICLKFVLMFFCTFSKIFLALVFDLW